jgi:hypothetical protein
MQGYALRNSNSRNSDDEPEIRSVFSTDKSTDYAVKPRKYKQTKYDTSEEQNERNTYNFGYEEPIDIPKPTQKGKQNRSKYSKQEIGVTDLKFSMLDTGLLKAPKYGECDFDDDSDDDDYLPTKFTYSTLIS